MTLAYDSYFGLNSCSQIPPMGYIPNNFGPMGPRLVHRPDSFEGHHKKETNVGKTIVTVFTGLAATILALKFGPKVIKAFKGAKTAHAAGDIVNKGVKKLYTSAGTKGNSFLDFFRGAFGMASKVAKP